MVFSGGPTLGETKKDQESKRAGRQDERCGGKNKATVTGQHGVGGSSELENQSMTSTTNTTTFTWIAKLKSDK